VVKAQAEELLPEISIFIVLLSETALSPRWKAHAARATRFYRSTVFIVNFRPRVQILGTRDYHRPIINSTVDELDYNFGRYRARKWIEVIFSGISIKIACSAHYAPSRMH